MPTKTQREREAEQRRAKLDRIDEQLRDGSLVIRRMTDEERARFARVRDERLEETDTPRPRRRSRGTARALPPAPRD